MDNAGYKVKHSKLANAGYKLKNTNWLMLDTR